MIHTHDFGIHFETYRHLRVIIANRPIRFIFILNQLTSSDPIPEAKWRALLSFSSIALGSRPASSSSFNFATSAFFPAAHHGSSNPATTSDAMFEAGSQVSGWPSFHSTKYSVDRPTTLEPRMPATSPTAGRESSGLSAVPEIRSSACTLVVLRIRRVVFGREVEYTVPTRGALLLRLQWCETRSVWLGTVKQGRAEERDSTLSIAASLNASPSGACCS